jgi:hypothetical protein
VDEVRQSGPHRGRRILMRWSKERRGGIPMMMSSVWWSATTLVSSMSIGREREEG